MCRDRQIRIFVAVNVLIYRDSLVGLFSGEVDMEVVGAWNGHSDSRLAALSEPDIIILHANGADNVEAIYQLRRATPTARIVAVALRDAEVDVVTCAAAGASGLLTKGATVDDLVAAVRGAMRGEVVCSPRTAAALLRHLAARATCGPPGDRSDLSLTRREWEVVELIDSGCSNREIAQHLGIEHATAKNHVHNLLSKLGVQSRSDVAARVCEIERRETVRLLSR